MPQGYSLDRASILKLREDHQELERQIKELRQQLRGLVRGPGVREDEVIAKVTAEISARSTNDDDNAVLGSGTVDIQHKGMVNDQELTSSSRSVTAYNLDEASVEVDTIVKLSRHFATGDWIVNVAGTSVASVNLHRVQLNEDMGATTSNEADADLLTLAGVDTGSDITVLDPHDLYKYALGPATYTYSGTITLDGARGYAIKSGSSYYLMECETIAKMIRFEVSTTGGFVTCDDTFEGYPRHNGWMEGQNPGERTITNPDTHCTGDSSNMFEGDYGDYGFARWSDTTGVYYVIQMECPDIVCESC